MTAYVWAISPYEVFVPSAGYMLHKASVTAGSAAFAAEENKHRSNDAKCAELGWVSISLAVETYAGDSIIKIPSFQYEVETVVIYLYAGNKLMEDQGKQHRAQWITLLYS
eukprot:Em0001g268a